jgi:raffinose/stachyose/melibiose transport system substrate-binding protein
MISTTAFAQGSKELGDSKSDAKEITTISLLASQDWVTDEEMERAKDFEDQTGIKIDFQIVPSAQYYNLLMTKLNSGEGPDIFGGQSGAFDLVSQYHIEDNAVDLSNESWVKNYDQFAKYQTSVNGKVYGMTYFDTTTDYYLIYNKKIFNELGLSVTNNFADFEKNCSKIMDHNITPIYEPVASGWHHVMWFSAVGGMYESNQPGLTEKLNNNKTSFAENKDFSVALNQINDLAQKGYFGDNYLSDVTDDAYPLIGSGEYAMYVGKPAEIKQIAASSNGKFSESDFGLMLIPLIDNDTLNVHPCGPSRFIYKDSKNIDAAKQYFDFLANPDTMQYIIDNSTKFENFPFNNVKETKYSSITTAFLKEHSAKSGMVFQDVVKYFNPQWMEIGQDLTSMFIEEMTPQEVLKGIDKRRASQAMASSDSNWN